MIRFLMDPPQKYKNPRSAGIVPLAIGGAFLILNILQIVFSGSYYPWVFVFGCLGFSYGLWIVLLGVPRDEHGDPKCWWAYWGFAFWILSIGTGVWIGFFRW